MRSTAPVLILADLKTRLSPLGYEQYGEMAPTDATFPYLTRDLDNSDADGEATESFRLDIDGWDSMIRTSGSTLPLETMMASVAAALQQQQNSDDTKLGFRYILEQRRGIEDPDVTIRRRKYTFEIRAIGKE